MIYQNYIHELDETVNPVGVEAKMRLTYGTLDHLDEQDFRKEIKIAKLCEEEMPGLMRETAETFWMEDEFDEWEERLKAEASAS